MEDVKQIDFVRIFKAIFKNKKRYLYTLPTAAVLASLLIIGVPRYYTCSVTMAPEASVMGGGGLSEMAASFGLDLGTTGKSSSDAILPDLYPDVVASIPFTVKLCKVKVTTEDGYTTDYYNYLRTRTKAPWWNKCIQWVKSLFSKPGKAGKATELDPFRLSRSEKGILEGINSSIKCAMDKKSYVISITVTDQDPLVSATMADSVKQHLQDFITEYRTSKARNDYEHACKLRDEAHAQYVAARKKYAAFADANEDVVLASYRTELEDLENEMQLKYNAYTNTATQVQAADAKVQERTPAFTTIQEASVPVKPAGPKRMIFVAIITLLAFFGTTGQIIYKDFKTEAGDE